MFDKDGSGSISYKEIIKIMKNFGYPMSKAEVDKMILEIKEASYYNFERWPILGVTVWPNPLGAEKRRTMKSEIDYLKEWMKRRFEWMDREINNL